jgi:hypothetical protein
VRDSKPVRVVTACYKYLTELPKLETYKQFKKDVLIGAMVLLVINAIYCLFDLSKDDSDSNEKRSNMNVRTDYKTGCQYLESSKGELTPRLQKDGTHLCL